MYGLKTRSNCGVPNEQFSYFQFRLLPSARHSMAWETSLSRVTWRFASAMQVCDASRAVGRVFAQMIPPPSMSRRTPATMTTMLRFRPLVLSDIAPSASPTIAIGMMIQLAQPSRGMNAMTTRTSATRPKMRENKVSHDQMFALLVDQRKGRQLPLVNHASLSGV